MRLEDLIAYAKEKYQIEEEHKWVDFPGFSVLRHPATGKWIALLMRQWDMDSGREIQRCDLKCGGESGLHLHKSFLHAPVRMRGEAWIDIDFGDDTERDLVFRLLDRAVSLGRSHGATIVLPSKTPEEQGPYRETALPFAGSVYQPEKELVPERLRQLRRSFVYGGESRESRAKNFCRQALLMQDYEDDFPWTGDLVCYFPSYQDLNTRQLRGYFTWRTKLRQGDVQPIPASAAYLYVYELLNGVGAATPEESLRKLAAFQRDFIDSGVGDKRMGPNLRRWMLEYAVLQDLSPELAREAADPKLLERDEALSALRFPEIHTNKEIFAALCYFGGKKLENSPVLAEDPERGQRLFCEAWTEASKYVWQEQDLFTLCFGRRASTPWYPLANALYYQRQSQPDRVYLLSDCRCFRCRKGRWTEESYPKTPVDKSRFQGFLHETDALLRRYLKTGRFLRENPADEWARPYIDAVIRADRKAVLEAARPKITIDLSGLEQIRRDADETRESLLTPEEMEEDRESVTALNREEKQEAGSPEITEELAPELPLDQVQIRILRSLLSGEDPAALIRSRHLMASVVADGINEALFDLIGDTVLLCEGDRLFLVDDYTEDLEQILGGTSNGGT